MAGLTLAISLRRQGFNPEIVERQPAWPVHGAGIYLVGNAMRVLGSLNLADEVLHDGSVIRTQTLMNDRGRKLAVIDTESVWADCGPCVGIRRASLQSILVNGLGTAEVRFAKTRLRSSSPMARSGRMTSWSAPTAYGHLSAVISSSTRSRAFAAKSDGDFS